MDKVATGAEEEIICEIDAELAIAAVGMSYDTEREMEETIAGGAWVETRANIASTRDAGRVGATVTAGIT